MAHLDAYGHHRGRGGADPKKSKADREAELRGRLVIDYVVPDYHASRPKACMGGWGRRFLAISPTGKALPCHAAASLPGFDFPDVRDRTLRDIWENSEAFARFRGTAWMPEPCRSCESREQDWGGCRCQAFALTGDAANTDPACAKSVHHHLLDVATRSACGDDAAAAAPRDFIYRRIGGAADPHPPAVKPVPADAPAE